MMIIASTMFAHEPRFLIASPGPTEKRTATIPKMMPVKGIIEDQILFIIKGDFCLWYFYGDEVKFNNIIIIHIRWKFKKGAIP